MKTKRTISVLLALALILALFAIPAAAEANEIQPRMRTEMVLSEYDKIYYPNACQWIQLNEVYTRITFQNGYNYTETAKNVTNIAQGLAGEMQYHYVRHYTTY